MAACTRWIDPIPLLMGKAPVATEAAVVNDPVFFDVRGPANPDCLFRPAAVLHFRADTRSRKGLDTTTASACGQLAVVLAPR
jgi:hypothetical protein